MTLLEYRKYGKAAEQLSGAIRSGRVSHAYIIEGDETIDKAGFARAFIKALLCRERPGEGCETCITCRKVEDGNYEDLYWIQAEGKKNSSALSVKADVIRQLSGDLAMIPTGGNRNIAVIEDADLMTVEAQNIFLKTLEEPAPGTVILLLTSNSQNLLPTINSRCMRCRLMTLTPDQDQESVRFAQEIYEMVSKKAFFFDICSRLDEELKDRKSADAFLDALESVFGDAVQHGADGMSRGQLVYGVKCIETARNHIRRNVRYNMAVREMILKLEEYR